MAKVERRAGSYSQRISLIDADTGRRVQKRVTARTKTELDRQVTALRAQHHRGEWSEPDMTPLIEWLDRWHATYSASESSRYVRAHHISGSIRDDPIAHIPLGRLRYSHIQDWIDRLAATGKSGRTIRSIATTLRMALGAAQRRRMISSNPCVDLSIPANAPTPWTVLTEQQVATILAATDIPDHGMWVLAVMLGIRRGELLALRWADWDQAAGTLRVERTLTRCEDGSYEVGSVAKTESSRRTLKLPAVCMAALSRQRVDQLTRRLAAGDIWDDSGAIFDDGLGSHHATPMLSWHRFRATRAALGLPETLRFHDTRHVAATMMLRAGIPVPMVSRILGHSNTGVTSRVYLHTIQGMEDEAVAVLDALFPAAM